MAERDSFARDNLRNTPTPSGTGAPNAMNRPQQMGGDIAGKAQEKASDLQSQVRQQAVSGLNGQKKMAADSLQSVAEAVRKTENQLREQNQGAVAEYAGNAAGQIERLSHYVRESDPEAMMGDVEQYARRQPAIFLGGAFLLGALGARFIRTSGQKRQATPPIRPGFGSPTPGMAARGGFRPEYGPQTPGNTGPQTPGRVVPWPKTDEPFGGTSGGQGQPGGSEV